MSLDPIIHQESRLRLMAILVVLEKNGWADFTSLKKVLGLTDGNLGAHLVKLEEAGYIKVDKKFVGRRPKTSLQATARGKAAFAAHREALKKILEG